MIVYFSILFLRFRAGKVTVQMLALPKAPYLAVGLLEALGAVCGMAAGGMVYVLYMYLSSFLFYLLCKIN